METPRARPKAAPLPSPAPRAPSLRRQAPSVAVALALASLFLLTASARAQEPRPPATPATPPAAAVPSTPAPAQPDTPKATTAAAPPDSAPPPSATAAGQLAPAPSPGATNPPASTTPGATKPPAPTTPGAAGQGDLGFDLFGDAKHPAPVETAREQARLAKLEQKVKLRRRLLVWHQALGFVTLGALAVTNIIGTLSYYDKYSSAGSDTGRFATWHEGLAIGTSIAFGTTGILALAAPNPYPKPIKLDAALLHKVMMALATAGMAAQLILGPISAISDGKLFQRDLALTHVVLGWSTFGFMGAGTLAYVF